MIRRPPKLVFITLGFALILSCSKKEESADSDPAVTEIETAQILQQPILRDPSLINIVLEELSLDSITFETSNFPNGNSNLITLETSISSPQATQYRYFMTTTSDCSSAIYGDWLDIRTPISEDLGSDGEKRICLQLTGILENGTTAIVSAGLSWTKDTTLPTLTVNPISGLGPNAFLGSDVPLTGAASDNLTGLESVGVSISTSGGCLNKSKTGFIASCPTFVDVSMEANDQWHLNIPKSLFGSGASYEFSVQAVDKTGNKKILSKAITVTWDSTAPAASSTIDVSGGEEKFAVSWNSVASAVQYLIVRRKESAVNYIPQIGVHFTKDQYLGNGNVVAFIDSSTSFTDTGVDANVFYFYKVFAIDGAYNIGSGISDSDVAVEIPRFKGIKWSNLSGHGLNAEAVWDPFTRGSVAHSLLTYELFVSDTEDGFDWDSPVVSVVGKTRTAFTIPPTASDASYVAVRERTPSGVQGSNSSSVKLNLSGGYFHRIANTNRYEGLDPTLEINPINIYALDHDQWGNIIFGEGTSNIYVFCKEVSSAPYCKGRINNKVYFLSGRDGRGDGDDEKIAAETQNGIIYGISVDLYGNVYFADHTYARIRVICMDPGNPASKFCFGKRTGYVYHFAGNGVRGDGIDDRLALAEPIGNPKSLKVNQYGNVYIVDDDYRRIRIVCTTTEGHYCLGKTAGNVYRIAGTGVAADGPDNVQADLNPMGLSYALDVDELENIYFTDVSYYRIRAICNNVTAASGFCSGKTSGNMYHIAGTGSNDGDGPPDYAALGSKIGTGYGIKLDSQRNIWYSDYTHKRIRVVCIDTASSGFCNGKTSGNIYWAAGTGFVSDGPDSSEAVINGIGTPYSISFDSDSNLVMADYSYERLRRLCINTTGTCQGKTAGYMYHIAGSSLAKKGPVSRAISSGVHIGDVTGVTKDSKGNIYFSDTLQDIVRVLCNDTSGTTGVCVGLEKGFVYRVAGTGSGADGSSDLPSNLTPLRDPYGLAVDGNDNLYIADSFYERIRVICYDVSTGFCQGKTAGFSYRAYGVGTSGDGVDDSDAASTQMGLPYAIDFDSLGNLYIADGLYGRIRTVCIDVTGGGFCNGKTAGNVYRFAGNGTTSDGADGVATSSAIGTPTGIAVDLNDNVYTTDFLNKRARVVCIDVASAGFCNGKVSGNVYRFAGTGAQLDGGDNAPASTEPMGAASSIAVDPAGNVYIGDYVYERVRVVCNESAYGYCAGKTIGNIYHYAGTGADTNDPTNLTPASQTRIGSPERSGMYIDDDGLLILTDRIYDSIRMITSY